MPPLLFWAPCLSSPIAHRTFATCGRISKYLVNEFERGLPGNAQLAMFRAPQRDLVLRPHLRRDARVVEWGGLENR